jgi:hypothetical protein
MARPKSNLTRKINAIANIFGVASSTVSRWHDEGCNISDPGEIISWRQKKRRIESAAPLSRPISKRL